MIKFRKNIINQKRKKKERKKEKPMDKSLFENRENGGTKRCELINGDRNKPEPKLMDVRNCQRLFLRNWSWEQTTDSTEGFFVASLQMLPGLDN